jgi:hypothetical protein
VRPAAKLRDNPASTRRIFNPEGCGQAAPSMEDIASA